MEPTLHQEEIARAVQREMDNLFKREFADIKAELVTVRSLLERMVRVEERQQSAIGETERLRNDVSVLFSRLNVLESNGAVNRHSLGSLERAAWMVAAAVVAWLSSMFSRGGH